MNKQDKIVSAMNTAADMVRSAMAASMDTWHALRTECGHHNHHTCTMNSEDIRVSNSKGTVDCTFKGCPYTNV